MRICKQELEGELRRVLCREGMEEPAVLCARLFAETDLDGVYTHGIARFPRFVEQIRRGIVAPGVSPEFVGGYGGIERWDGGSGPGNASAYLSMARAVELARGHGAGVVALRNTNHWMRGGSYGWQAAEEGMVGLCWTNTMPNLPPWGSSEPGIGNNPLVLAVPREEGHVVLDSAMSMFSYGALAAYRSRGETLPVDGGYDEAGKTTRDPAAIEITGRPLPAGLWKGSGLAILLDMMATILSGGRATHEIAADPVRETGMSQVFIAIHPSGPFAGGAGGEGGVADSIVNHVHACATAEGHGRVSYPGERTLETRRENQRLGIPVDQSLWEAVRAL